MRADQDVDLALGEVGEHLLRVLGLRKRETISTRTGKSRKRSRKVFQCCWASTVVGTSISVCLPFSAAAKAARTGDLRLAEADVAADEPVHRPRRLEVLLDRLDRRLLVVGLPVGEARLQLLEVLVAEVVGEPRRLLALRVEAQELARELADALPGPALEELPGLPAQLRERRRPVHPDVARDLAELLVRDVEAVVSSEREQQVVARDPGDLLGLEPEQLADPVVFVDDVVAGAQVGERLERAADARRGARFAPEDLRVRQQGDAEVAPDEAAPGRRDRVEQLGIAGKLVARLRRDGTRRGGAGSGCEAPRPGGRRRRRP